MSGERGLGAAQFGIGSGSGSGSSITSIVGRIHPSSYELDDAELFDLLYAKYSESVS